MSCGAILPQNYHKFEVKYYWLRGTGNTQASTPTTQDAVNYMEPQIGESKQFDFFGFPLEGFRTTSNEYALNPSEAGEILSMSLDTFRIKALRTLKERYIEFDLAYECNGWAVTVDAISVKTFATFVYALCKEGYRPALNLIQSLGSFDPLHLIQAFSEEDSPKSSTKKKLDTEKKVQQGLSRSLRGQMEVYCPSGYIDILTPDQVIEVKLWTGWKAAIGQVLAYGQHYPSHSMRIHLFGSIPAEKVLAISSYCESLGIVASFE